MGAALAPATRPCRVFGRKQDTRGRALRGSEDFLIQRENFGLFCTVALTQLRCGGLSTRSRFGLFWPRYLVLMNKFEFLIPWWVENREKSNTPKLWMPHSIVPNYKSPLSDLLLGSARTGSETGRHPWGLGLGGLEGVIYVRPKQERQQDEASQTNIGALKTA